MGSFGDTIQNVKKVNNHAKGALRKIQLRRKILEAMKPAGPVSVLDCYAGSGVMWRKVWHDADSYVGCDLEWKLSFEHRAYCVDNCRLLRCLDLEKFNVFDLDAYGSPWEQATIIAARRRLKDGELLGLALTDGSAMRARLGKVEWKLAAIAGVDVDLRGAQRDWTAITARALSEVARRMGGQVVSHWEGEPDGRPMLYSAALLRGL